MLFNWGVPILVAVAYQFFGVSPSFFALSTLNLGAFHHIFPNLDFCGIRHHVPFFATFLAGQPPLPNVPLQKICKAFYQGLTNHFFSLRPD